MTKLTAPSRYVRFAQLAYQAARVSYPKYRRKKSKKTFTQPQKLWACVLADLKVKENVIAGTTAWLVRTTLEDGDGSREAGDQTQVRWRDAFGGSRLKERQNREPLIKAVVYNLHR